MSTRFSKVEQRRLYVGNLYPGTRSKELNALFKVYGKVVDTAIVAKNGNAHQRPFGFVSFEDYRDARDAVEALDGYTFMGRKLRVEFTHGGVRPDDRARRTRVFTVHRTRYRVIVTGLPVSTSWQDLKDHMRAAGEVAFSDVYKDGSGVIEYYNQDDVNYAIKKLDDTKLKTHEGHFKYIRVRADSDGCSKSRSRSSSRSRSRSLVSRRHERHFRRESPVPRTPPENRRRR